MSVTNLVKFIYKWYEFRSKIKNLLFTKLDTNYGNGFYSLIRTYFVYILFQVEVYLYEMEYGLTRYNLQVDSVDVDTHAKQPSRVLGSCEARVTSLGLTVAVPS